SNREHAVLGICGRLVVIPLFAVERLVAVEIDELEDGLHVLCRQLVDRQLAVAVLVQLRERLARRFHVHVVARIVLGGSEAVDVQRVALNQSPGLDPERGPPPHHTRSPFFASYAVSRNEPATRICVPPAAGRYTIGVEWPLFASGRAVRHRSLPL